MKNIVLTLSTFIVLFGMTLSIFGVLFSYDKETFNFSVFNLICWMIGGMILFIIYKDKN